MKMSHNLSVGRRRGGARLFLMATLLTVFAGGLLAGAWWQTSRHGSSDASAAAPAAGQLWTCGMHPQVLQDRPGRCPICAMQLTPVQPAAGGAQAAERKVRYWWDPMMNPPYISQHPGRSPMGMDLVPVYDDEVAAGEALTIDPAMVQNMGLRLASVVEAPLERTVRAVGVLAEPEPARHDVNLRVGGWIDRLHAGTEGMRIARGDPLFDLYSPELQVAVEELIGARKMAESPAARAQAAPILRAAERKLELYGLEPAQIAELAALATAPRAVTFRSPADGYLAAKTVFGGSAVAAGDTVMRISDTSTMWLDTRVFEKDLAFIALGQEVSAQVDGRPGETLAGRVILIHPRIDAATRTALVRIELANADLRLRDGRFATAVMRVTIAARAVVVPREAIIDTGARQVAFVALDAGHFEPRQVAMGASGDAGMVEVRSGLAPGEQVVVSGQFLLDAESRMRESIRRFLQEKSAPPSAAVTADDDPAWRSAATAALDAYLTLARALGLPQTSEEPADFTPLAQAASALRERAMGAAQESMVGALAAAADAMQDATQAQQRERFAALSEAMIAIAQRLPPGNRPLFIAQCPMAGARWLQDEEAIANPYFPTDMKDCGEIVSRLPAGQGDGQR